VKNAYAYKVTKERVIALGTDFPVEEVNPMLTFMQHLPERIARVS
jgi:predicted amidohydrolase YtcJ